MKVKLCPACDGRDVTLYHPEKWEGMFGLTRERCENCGYVGPMTVMEREEAEKLKVKKVRK